MESKNGLLGQRSGVWRSLRDGDFEEEDVWAILREKTDHSSFNSNSKVTRSNKEPSSVSAPKHVPTASRRIARASGGSCSSSISSCSAGNSISEPKITQQSAPVNIPDWSKIHKHKSKKAYENHDYDDDDSDGKVDFNNDDDDDSDGKVDFNNDGYDDKLPPHEFIARRLARSQISSFSVFEGVGRTLKGRDLSKVRNAVLTKTGFLESL